MGEDGEEGDDRDSDNSRGYQGCDDEGGFNGAHVLAFRWGRFFLLFCISMIHGGGDNTSSVVRFLVGCRRGFSCVGTGLYFCGGWGLG